LTKSFRGFCPYTPVNSVQKEGRHLAAFFFVWRRGGNIVPRLPGRGMENGPPGNDGLFLSRFPVEKCENSPRGGADRAFPVHWRIHRRFPGGLIPRPALCDTLGYT
jgi:hypothetical protein